MSGVDHLFLCRHKVRWTDFHHSCHLQLVRDPKPADCWGIHQILSRERREKVRNDHVTFQNKRFYTEASDNSSVAFGFKIKRILQKHFSWLHWPYFPGLPPMLAPAPPASVLNLFKHIWKSWAIWNTKIKLHVQCLRWVTHHIFPVLCLGRSVDGGHYHNLDRNDRTFKVLENETDMN